MAAASAALAFAPGMKAHAGKPTTHESARRTFATATGQPAQHVLPTAPLDGMSLRLKGVKVNSRLENGNLVVQGFSGSLGGGKVQASGRVNTGDKNGAQHVNAQFDDVELAQVLDLLGINMVSAGVSNVRADGVVNLRWNGLKADTIRRSISGTAVVKSGPGTISKSSPLLDRLASSAGISDPEDLSFTSSRIELNAHSGTVQVKSLVIQGPDVQLAAAGTIDVAAGQINLLMDVNVSPAIASKSNFYKLQSLASVFGKKQELNADGYVEIPRITVAGALNSPDINMDTGARQQAAATPGKASGQQDIAAAPVSEQEETVGAQPVPGRSNLVVQKGADEAKHAPFWRNVLKRKSEPGESTSSTDETR